MNDSAPCATRGPMYRPMDVLSDVLDMFEYAARKQVHERIGEVVRMFVYEEAKLRLDGLGPVPREPAYLLVISEVRDPIRRHLSKHRVGLDRVDTVVRELETLVHRKAHAGTDGPSPAR
ncbi:hypothetical protein SMC26_40150 [Actinomadura fulvescens]|uniref:Uncharacterized protein n=1 Tax=Actinomadura fulvescens TaxID=46160 RepID=A0ABN3Q5T3_9ACTN